MTVSFWTIFVILTVVVLGVLSEGFGDDEEELDAPRVELDTDRQPWKQIATDQDDWSQPGDNIKIPDAPQFPQPPPRRRRIRKRKRRPMPPPPPDVDLIETAHQHRKRLGPMREAWAEMEALSSRQQHIRRRVTPKFPEEELKNEEIVRDPLTALMEEEQRRQLKETTTDASDTTNVPKLKAVLKSNGPMSLSELLQQKNLSLAELLSGGPQVLQVLTERAAVMNEVVSEYNYANGTSTTTEEAQMLADGIGDVVSSTERRMFVSSLPKYYTSEEETKTSEATTKPSENINRNRLNLKPKLRAPVTPRSTTQKQFVEENYPKLPIFPSKALKINITELMQNKETGPLKMTIDIEHTTQTSKDPEITTNTITTEQTQKNRVKSELMEILKDPMSRDRLARILDYRNMTLEELIEHRERGSSQVHLADIFHSRQKEPEPNEEHVGHVVEGPMRMPVRDVAEEGFKQVEVTAAPERPVYTVTSFPMFKIGANQREELVSPKSSYVPSKDIVEATAKPVDLNEVNRIEDVDNAVAESINDQLNVEVRHNYLEEMSIPIGVKSAIIASAAIIGTSLLIFLTIFAVFRWTQKQRNKLDYVNSFSECRIKSPILKGPPKPSIKTIMTETLGKGKAYYRNYVPNITDIAWDRGKKPYM